MHRTLCLALLAGSLGLTSCATSSGKTSPILDACPPSLTADVPVTPKIPEGAGIPQPVSSEERSSFGKYGVWLGEFGHHDRDVTGRLQDGHDWCAKRGQAAIAKPKRRWLF